MARRRVLASALLLMCWSLAAADPAAPALPETYQATLRFQIDARGNDRIAQYLEMMRHLRSLGFVRHPDEVEQAENEAEEPRITRIRGTLPSRSLPRLFDNRSIRAVRLVPIGAALPEEKDARLRVDLRLAGKLSRPRQRVLADQVRKVLEPLGYKDAIGYDHRDHTRLLGTIPAEQLDVLLEDLRQQPTAAGLSAPFSNATPIRIVEVRPDLPAPSARPGPAAAPEGEERLSPELRAHVADQAKAAAPTRMEVLLALPPEANDRTWLRWFPNAAVEGQLGTLVTVVAPAEAARQWVQRPEVIGVRLPRAGRSQVLDPSRVEDARPLQATGLARLHALGHRGKGTRMAIVDSDFRGWEAARGNGLPKSTELLDLTRERNRDLQPDPMPTGMGMGTGTRCALAAVRAAPEVELVLIRVDPAAPYLLQTAARAINGDAYPSLALEQRAQELEQDRRDLDVRQEQLALDRRAIADEFGEEGEEAERRKAFLKKQADYERDRRELSARTRRYLDHVRALEQLRGVRVVANALLWEDGFPVDGSSVLSRWFDDRPFAAALWFQSAGDARGQAWTGPLRDRDGNGVFEFVTPETPLPAGLWTPELNFLGWQPTAGTAAVELPANARIRLSIQWREPHDPSYWRAGEDAYREPIADFRLLLLRQLDPAGTRQPADDLEVVAASSGVPLRLQAGPSAATYEQVVEFRVAQPGRYALRVEGGIPNSDRPRNAPTLPEQQRMLEIQPRLFVRTLEGPGRAVFSSFSTAAASIGMPGDATAVATIGAANAAGQPEPYSSPGPILNIALLDKPTVLAYDEAGGTGIAASFAAGLAATLRSAGFSLYDCWQTMRQERGEVFRVPTAKPSR